MATIIRLAHAPALAWEHYRLLVDTVDEYGIFMLDAQGYVATWNRGAQRLKGYASEEIIGRHFSVFYPPDDVAAEKPKRELELARTDGKVIDEAWRLRKDGSRFWANVTITALRDEAGELVGYAKVTRDVTDQRAREDELRRSEERFRLLIESVSDYALYMLDRAGYVTSWNPGAQRIKGYSAAEIVGQHFSVFFPPEATRVGQPERELTIAAEQGRFEDDNWRIRKDGSRFWANVVITAIRDTQGALVGFAKVTRDLTSRRLADEQLRRSEERLRLLVDAVSDYAVYMLDPGGFVTTWNQGAQRLKGYSPEEIIGRHFSCFFPAEAVSRGKPEAELQAARQDGRLEEENWRVRKDGTRFWASVVITPIRGAQGELMGFAKVTRDLTTRRRAEEELRRSEERLRFLIEAVSDYAVYMLDPSGYVTTWNIGAQRIKGYSAAEIIGKHFSLFFPLQSVSAGRPDEELVQARKYGRFEEEGWRVRKDGSRFWANVVITPILDAEGALVGFAKVTQDLTTRMKAEQAARTLAVEKSAREAAEANEIRLQEAIEKAASAAKEAEAASRMKDDFLATVSHELRTPLNAILGWSSVLRRREFDTATANALDVIQRNAVAQAKIIDDILDVSRIVAGKLRLEMTQVDLCSVARAELDVVRPAADAKGISLQFSAEQQACLVVADPTRLQQVLWNLLSNAVKFTGDNGKVEVSLSRRGTRAVLVVRDSGRGIEPAFLPFAFDPFKQADASTTRRVGGLGLGLAIVRNIVELHGGEVSVVSEGLGKGASFTVALPIRVVSPTQLSCAVHDSKQDTAAQPSLRGVRVVVVDDEPDARDLLKRVLEEHGCEVHAASSTVEALELVRRLRPHVLISDVGMPDQDGYSLMRQVRALGPASGGALPSIALTAYTQAKDRADALTAGFTTHIPKPVDPSELVIAVANLVSITRA